MTARPRAWLSAETLFAGFGVAACMLIFVGVLKSLPGVQRLPVDITPVLLVVTLLHLAGLLACRVVVLPAAVPMLLALHAAFAGVAIVGAGLGQGRTIFPDKLRDVVLVAPVMIVLGAAVAADRAAFRRFLATAKLIGPLMGAFIAGAFAFGLVNVVIQFGGKGSVTTHRVQYQLANLMIALAASGYAVAALRTRGRWRLANAAMTALLAFAALIPGGRSGFVGLCLAAVIGPFLYLWHAGRRRQAVGLAVVLAALLAIAIAGVFASAQLAGSLRTVARFTQGNIAESSSRLPLWRAAFHLIETNGPLGVGFGAYTASAGLGTARDLYPHNLFIEALVELGLPGFVLYLGMWATAGLAWAGAIQRTDGEQWATSAAFGVIMLIMILLSSDLGNPLMWFCLGLLAGSGGATASRWPPPQPPG
jgi:O-antigen ligase